MAKPDCYQSRDIISMTNTEKRVPHFFMDRYFSDTRGTTADKVVLGTYSGKVQMAPFSGICAPGKPVKRLDRARALLEVKPPMIHLSDTVTICDNEEFRVNDDGSFNDSYPSRMAAAVTREATDQRDAIRKRIAWMCGMLIVNGQYLVSGVDMTDTMMDFHRPAANLVDLTAGPSGDLWSANTANIFAQLTAYSRIMGANGQIDVLMSPEASVAAFDHHEFQDWVKNCCANVAPVLSADQRGPQGFAFAKLEAENASYSFWTVQETYTDGAGNEVPFIPPGGVALVNRAAFNGVRVFAAIPRPDGSLQRGTIIPRDYIDESCDCRKIGSKSRPLPLARNIKASMFIQAV